MRDKIRLVSTAGTGYFYTTTKNKRTMPEKMEIKKFDPPGSIALRLPFCSLLITPPIVKEPKHLLN